MVSSSATHPHTRSQLYMMRTSNQARYFQYLQIISFEIFLIMVTQYSHYASLLSRAQIKNISFFILKQFYVVFFSNSCFEYQKRILINI